MGQEDDTAVANEVGAYVTANVKTESDVAMSVVGADVVDGAVVGYNVSTRSADN